MSTDLVSIAPNGHHRIPIEAGARPLAIVPTNMDQVARMAKMIVDSGLAPKGLETPQKVAVAIMHGLEIGLTPMTALQRIAVVNGRPTIWGDAAIGLVRGSGLCEWIKETITGTGDARTATCEAKRKGEPATIIRSFSVSDAKKAGLWAKGGPWQQYPDRMLMMRGRAFALRDGFADVLGGLYLKEEMEDAPAIAVPIPPSPAVEPKHLASAKTPPVPPEPPMPPASTRDAPADPPSSPKPQLEPPPNLSRLVTNYRDAALEAEDGDALDRAWTKYVSPFEATMPKEIYEACAAIDDQRRNMLE